MSIIYNKITDIVGNTPILRLNMEGLEAEILIKLEFFNPLSSVKDRIGLAMIEALEKENRIGAETTIIEPTSGNTGIALAFVCAAKNYNLILTMPENMSVERQKMLRLLGAELHLTPVQEGMKGAIEKAHTLYEKIKGAVIPGQFDNPANPLMHERTTAQEIWRDTQGHVDAIVVGVGTGGTLTGVGRALKPKIPHLQLVAVEPEDSPMLSAGHAGRHKIQGIGAGFIPKNLDTKLIDTVLTVANETAFRMARCMAKSHGIPCGISSGANIAAAIELTKKSHMKGKRILTFAPSMAERYLSSDLFDSYAAKNSDNVKL